VALPALAAECRAAAAQVLLSASQPCSNRPVCVLIVLDVLTAVVQSI